MDFKEIQSIIQDFEKSNLTTLEIESDGFKLKLSKTNQSVVQETTTNKLEEKPTRNETEVVKAPTGFEVKSPLVGTYYAANSPKDRPFVTVGQRVEEGDPLCIIEAMKIMNEITAPVSGVVEAINVKNDAPVGFDQVLMVIV